ncbi:MAG: HAMP domain-containing protein [Clostridia bacterium]|nr:HAMP domain-containing protein [Clostridia bacterium]
MKIRFKKRKNKKIYASVFRSYTAVVVLVLMLACLFSYNLVRAYVYKHHSGELLKQAATIAADASEAPDWNTLKKYQKLLDARIIYVNARYRAVFSEDPDVKDEYGDVLITVKSIESENDRRIVDETLRGEKKTGISRIDFLALDAIYASIPLYNSSGEQYGGLIVACPANSVNGIWKHIITSMMMAALLAMAFVTAVTTALARRFTEPLSNMKDAALKMAEGDYTTRVKIFKDDEIGKLGVSINLLSERLEEVVQNLRDEKCKLEMVLENIGEGLVSCDRTGKIIHVNNSALAFLEISSWDSSNTPFESEKKEIILSLLKRCMENGAQENDTFKNRSQRDILILATPILNAEGLLLGGVCLLRDVSEEIRLEMRRREYIANVSHELRTPLTGIRGMIEPLIDNILETEEEKQDSYRIIDKEAARLEKMIGEMLELSRLQDGKNTQALERVDLLLPVGSAVHATRMLAEKAGIQLVFETDGEVFVFGVENRIQQLIMILLDNAISFTPEGGKITVSIQKGKCKALVKVKDTGVGIEPKHLPYIWERFYKADTSRMRTTGTGLGLAIAKCIVEMMGGCISVQSEPGAGTEFTVRLKYFDET